MCACNAYADQDSAMGCTTEAHVVSMFHWCCRFAQLCLATHHCPHASVIPSLATPLLTAPTMASAMPPLLPASASLALPVPTAASPLGYVTAQQQLPIAAPHLATPLRSAAVLVLWTVWVAAVTQVGHVMHGTRKMQPIQLVHCTS